jgi:arsenical pump membrane protein
VAGIVRAAAVPFLLFVLGLGLVVRALTDHGLGPAITRLLPHGSSLPALLAIAFLAAAIANLVNNLPAVLMLLAAVTGAAGHSGAGLAGPVLAVLIGVNIGPNLTYAGSLATLLWRRLLAERDRDVDLGEFTRLGLVTVPAGLAVATVALWLGLRFTGLT